ncbi:MAG TPA: penicillin-binding protein 2 [Candidatus Paceibacterota bacterium]
MSLVIFIVTIAFVSRLYYLQIMHGDDYTARADHEFMTPSNPLFERGTIYFTTKDGVQIAAATNQKGVELAVQPPLIHDQDALYTALNSVVPLDKGDFMTKISRPGAQYVVLADELSTTTGAAIQALKQTGVVVSQDVWRFYPAHSLAAQTVGFVGYDGDELVGRYGLERQYEQTLERVNDDLYANFFVQLFAGVKQAVSGQTEGDVVTTIEPSVQAELERQLAQYIQTWHPAVAGGIIMDPQTGAIYAMAQAPTFDLNEYGAQSDPGVYTNALSQHVYEMGSIIKPLTMAAGIDSGVITPDTTYNDTGCITVNTMRICNYDLKARGIIPMQQILSQSLNVGVSFIATRLGPDRFRDYFVNRYQLGERTGVDLPSEASGLISNLNNQRQVEDDTAAFGQGIALTPLETVRALSSLANGGKLVTPHLGSSVRTIAGLSESIDWGQGMQILSPTTTQEVTQMLTTVVDTALEHGAVKLDHYSVAAKTGTAQIVDPSTGKYYPDLYLHSFFGYFPSYNARFVIFLFALKPVGAQYASQTWTTVFHDLTLFLINYYQIPPDR